MPITEKTMEELHGMKCMICGSEVEFIPQGCTRNGDDHQSTVHSFSCSECDMRYTLWDLRIVDLYEYYEKMRKRNSSQIRTRENER